MDGLRASAVESVLIPAWIDDGETWTHNLQRDFGLSDDEWIGFAWNRVRALQKDKNDLWKRVGEAWQRNEITLAQHHQMLDLELPAGIDGSLRRSDIESQAQLGGLLGPALGKSRGIIDVLPYLSPFGGTKAMALPSPPDEKAADKFVPEDADEVMSEDDLVDGIPLNGDGEKSDQSTLDDLVEEMEERIKEIDPDMAGIFDAVPVEDEDDEDDETDTKKARRLQTKVPGPKNSWKWDEDSQRYRWPNTKRAVPPARVAKLRERLIIDSRKRLGQLGDDYLDGKISLSKLQKDIRLELTRSHTSMRMLAVGGQQGMKRSDFAAAHSAMKKELGHLSTFMSKLGNGELSEKQFKNRLSMYAGGSMRQTFAGGQLDRHRKAGFTRKRRNIKSSKPCATCSAEAAVGWTGIDESGFVIGETECRGNDQCEITYDKGVII